MFLKNEPETSSMMASLKNSKDIIIYFILKKKSQTNSERHGSVQFKSRDSL